MSVCVGATVFDEWHSLPLMGGWTDTFVFIMPADAGLPPADYARLLRRMTPMVTKLRRSASLWVKIGAAPGQWYANVVRQTLRGIPLPYAVTAADQPPAVTDFSFPPWTDVVPSPPPPQADFTRDIGLTAPETTVLRVLARLADGYTAEIASLAGMDRTTTRTVLRKLHEQKLIEPMADSDYPRWKATRRGISLALRSWGVPPQIPFTARRENRLQTGSEHQRPARLWTAWLRRAWRHADVWTGWSELALDRNLYPDALAWGRLNGYETLFWLEVETGHLSREQIRVKTRRRFLAAASYTRKQGVRLVFCVLAPHWVREAVATIFTEISEDTAVAIGDWKSFGELPLVGFGEMGLTGQLTAPRYTRGRTKEGIERKRLKSPGFADP